MTTLNPLTIYYASAVIAGDKGQKFHLRRVFNELIKDHHTVQTTHIARDDVLDWERFLPKTQTIPRRDLTWLNDSDVLIADITWPTTGGGLEVQYALDTLRIPVLALHQTEASASRMVTEHKHPLLNVAQYTTLEQNLAITKEFLETSAPQFTLHPKYVGWCGIDGSGKGVMNEAFTTVMSEKGLQVFDAIMYMKEHNEVPRWEDLRQDTQALLVCEPTYEGLGNLIRQEMIKKGSQWSSQSVSQGYALNRQHLLSRLVLPALADGAWVGTDRHELSSEHYQPLHAQMWEGQTREVLQGLVRGLEGNKLALANPPGLFVLAHAPAEVALQRLLARGDKQDDAGYEELDFLTKLAARYTDTSLRTPYVRRGTTFVDFAYVQQERKDTLLRAEQLLREYVH